MNSVINGALISQIEFKRLNSTNFSKDISRRSSISPGDNLAGDLLKKNSQNKLSANFLPISDFISTSQNAYPWNGSNPAVKLQREKIKEYRLHIDICRLIETRIRGGFKDIKLEYTLVAAGMSSPDAKSGSKPKTTPAVVFTMYLVWKPMITIEYQIIALCSVKEKLKSYGDNYEPLDSNNVFVTNNQRILASLASNSLEIGPILRSNEVRIEIRIAAYANFVFLFLF